MWKKIIVVISHSLSRCKKLFFRRMKRKTFYLEWKIVRNCDQFFIDGWKGKQGDPIIALTLLRMGGHTDVSQFQLKIRSLWVVAFLSISQQMLLIGRVVVVWIKRRQKRRSFLTFLFRYAKKFPRITSNVVLAFATNLDGKLRPSFFYSFYLLSPVVIQWINLNFGLGFRNGKSILFVKYTGTGASNLL